MYHKKNVDYAYLLWEDFIYQVENKNVKKSNEMYYPRFTKVIVNFFMTMDQLIPRRNSVNWYYARDDYMFTMIKVVSMHEDTQLYSAILPNELMNEDIRNSESFKEYYAIASGAEPPKTKARVKKKQVGSDMSKTPPTKGKRLKTSAKEAKTAKKKQPTKTSKAKGLSVLSDKSSEEDDDDEVNVSEDDDDDNDDDIDKDDEDDDADNQDDENPDDANQDDDDEQIESDNDGDDFVHPKLSTHDDEARQDDVVNEEESDEESDDESNEDSDEEVQGAIIEEKEMDEEATHEEDEANELYRDVNVNLEGRDTEMTDAPLPNVQGTQVIEDTHVIITAPVNPEGQQQSSSVSSGFVSNMLNPSPDTGIDTIFTLNTEATSLVDVPVTTIAEPPLLSATTLPPTPLITHLQQTPVPTPATVPSSSLQDLPNFGSLFGFDHRLKTLETDFSEFKQTNQFAEAVSSIPGIVDAYLANKMHEAVKTAVQLQSKRLRDEAQAKNADFLNKLDDNIKKIIKDQVKEQVKAQVSKILPKIEKTVNEQLEAEVMTRSSTESKTSLAIAANLSKLELKKILIDKMESNKSIHRSDEQKNFYKALVDAYESGKLILDTYGDTISFKICRDDDDKDKEPSAGSNRGSKRRRPGKELESTNAPKEKTSKTSGKSHEGSKSQHKTAGEPAQTEDPMHTTKDLEEPAHQEFKTGVTEDQHNEETSQFPDYLVELEYLFEEVYKATTEQLDWNNPEGQQYLHDLRKPLPLIPNSRGRRVIPFDQFINNDLEYLSDECGVKSRESASDVYSKRRIIAVTKLEIVDWHNYKHLDWITVRRDDDKLYKFKEGDFNRLHIQDIEDMLLLLVQGKLINLTVKERLAFNVSLRISDLKRREAYTAYSNPRGFIYQNKDKKNRLMRIDKLHKFSDGAMIQAIDKQLKTRRIMRSLEKFVGGRPYDGDFRLLQRTKDCDGIPKRPTMYLNLWSYKVVRHRYSNPMIQPEPEGSTQGYPLVNVEVLRLNTSAGNPVKEILLKLNLPDHRSILMDSKVTPTKHGRITKPYSSPLFIANCFSTGYLKMEVKKRSIKVQRISKEFCHYDTERLSRSDEVLKLKNFKKDAIFKAFSR
ncbi:hypothetical protein Tco_0185279 [Tanacetum coccineum]